MAERIRILYVPKAGKARVLRRKIGASGNIQIAKGKSFAVESGSTCPYKNGTICVYREGESTAIPLLSGSLQSVPSASQIDEIGQSNLIQQLHGAVMASKRGEVSFWIMIIGFGIIVMALMYLGVQLNELQDITHGLAPKPPNPTGSIVTG